MKEFAIRKVLGGYWPEDPLQVDFYMGLLSIRNKDAEKNNTMAHLHYLIQKNR